MRHAPARGKWAEDRAVDFLVQQMGCTLLARNVRLAGGEIDLVVADGEMHVFVEVKARAGQEFGGGAAAVTWRKQRRIARVALEFLARHGTTDVPCRFDVVVVTPGPVPRVEVYTHAFAVS